MNAITRLHLSAIVAAASAAVLLGSPAKEGPFVQINGVGPLDVTYLDPRDDPRRQAQ